MMYVSNVCMYVVCMYVCMYLYIYIYIYIYMYMYMYRHIYLYIYVCVCVSCVIYETPGEAGQSWPAAPALIEISQARIVVKL